MQHGFMTGSSTTIGIFIVRQLQEKHLAANRPFFMAFVDLEKVSDHVPLETIDLVGDVIAGNQKVAYATGPVHAHKLEK